MNVLLRRRKLGRGSCNGIVAAASSPFYVCRNWRDTMPNGVNYLFRWGCTSNAGVGPNTVVVNSAAAIRWCSDKRQGRLDMQEAGVSVPRTFTAEEFMTREFAAEEYVPYVLRRAQHAQGRDLWHGGIPTIKRAIVQHGVQGGYVSEYISKVAEYRVAVIQGRVAWVARKTPGNPDAVAWNVAQGGRFDNVRFGDWPMDVVNEALKAAKVSGTDFCGVDVMLDSNEVAFVLEVNSAPSLTSPYRQQCFAKCFDYISLGKEALPLTMARTWKEAVHPAIWQRESDDA